MRVFVVEDDPIITEGLTAALRQEGYTVGAAPDMARALSEVRGGEPYDVYLLDVMLPDGDGYQICRAVRERSDAPILFLTACDDEIHTVLGLEGGADDYIAKPFRIRELLARIKAVLRRRAGGGAAAPERETVSVGRNEVDLSSGRVFRNGAEVFLSAAEYRLLLTFIRNRGQLLTRRQILNEMWDGMGDFVNDNTLTVYVRRLRKKLEDDGDEAVIGTVRGIGYRMEK